MHKSTDLLAEHPLRQRLNDSFFQTADFMRNRRG